jgi:hypothetical protein
MNYYPNPNYMGGAVPTAPSYSYPLGYGGYNGSYFSNNAGYNYYNNFNPYAVQQQMEQERARQQQQLRYQQNLFAKLYRTSCDGIEVPAHERVIDSIYGNQTAQQIERIPELTPMEQFEYEAIVQRERREREINSMIQNQMYYAGPTHQQLVFYQNQENWNKYAQKQMQDIPNDVGIKEFFNDGYGCNLYIEAIENERKAENQRLQQLYNQSQYNQFMQQFNMNGFVNNNIADMSVRMPSVINETERNNRRIEFVNKILGR